MSLKIEILQEIFVKKNGILNQKEFDKLFSLSVKLQRPLERIIMEKKLISQRYLLQMLGSYFSVPSAELKIADIDKEALKSINENFAVNNLVVPFAKEGNKLKVAMTDPLNKQLLQAMEKSTGMRIKPHIALERSIRRVCVLYKGSVKEVLERAMTHIGDKNMSEESSNKMLLNTIIESAVVIEASDIHIEPFEEDVFVRLRVDGMLRTIIVLPKLFHEEMISRIKVMSGLLMDEHRIPQDGRFHVNIENQAVDVRVSIIPSYWGEKVAMRVLLKEGLLYDLTSLGLLASDLELIKKYIQRPFGMVLACGPTGSGKTTTLYSFIQQIGMEKIDVINISTIEDPIEYSIPRVTQMQIHPKVDLTFAVGLRALLRQDPDIIMVGEIRDKETADIAVRVSLTGRLLFSTLHTNDAVSAIPRLLDIGIEPYLISSTLSLVIGQRLIRKICPHCRESYVVDNKTMEKIKQFYDYDYAVESLRKAGILGKSKDPFSDIRFFRAKGCVQCDYLGYQGRTSVFEILEISDEIKNLIMNASRDCDYIKKAAMKNGFKTLSVDGLAKVILGITDLDEVMRTTI